MSYFVEILLPITKDAERDQIETVREELTSQFGGVTLHINAPAEGLWKDEGEIERDRIVVAEVMTEDLDRVWWVSYRKDLERRFEQDEIVIRATMIERL